MLSEEEADELERVIYNFKVEWQKHRGIEDSAFDLSYIKYEQQVHTILWLALLLKKTSLELVQVTKELQDANELSANLTERYEDYAE